MHAILCANYPFALLYTRSPAIKHRIN